MIFINILEQPAFSNVIDNPMLLAVANLGSRGPGLNFEGGVSDYKLYCFIFYIFFSFKNNIFRAQTQRRMLLDNVYANETREKITFTL